MLKSLDEDSHVKTRLCQYEALKDNRAFEIAKQFVRSKIEGQNIVLKKYGLKTDTSVRLKIDAIQTESLALLRRRLTQIEARFSHFYFKQILQLIPEKIRPEGRTGFNAYDGLNNVFNFAYYVLKCRVHKALLKAKLEPYLVFLHSVQHGKPSLVCDIQELYRYLIDDYLIERCRKLRKKDFVVVTDFMMRLKMGKRIHLIEYEADSLAQGLNNLFQREVEIPRIKHGRRQTLDTLISEEALLLATFMRNEQKEWKPRIPKL
jgi:CRISPR-associated endonuclease Cas1